MNKRCFIHPEPGTRGKLVLHLNIPLTECRYWNTSPNNCTSYVCLHRSFTTPYVNIPVRCLTQPKSHCTVHFLKNTAKYCVRCSASRLLIPGSVPVQAPVPLTKFRSNLKFDQNLECYTLLCALPITTKFCTRHDSATVVTCAKFHCDRLSIFQAR